jgi:predicted porin
MKRSSLVSTLLLTIGAIVAVSALPQSAKADVTLFDRDGWTFYTSGLVAAHYQLVSGDADPTGSKNFSGGQILDEIATSDQRDGSIKLSNVRSGFVGTQIGFGMNRQINTDLRVESFFSLNVAGINNNRGQEHLKGIDYREAWASLVTPFGSLKFGRMFGLFASASAQVQILAWRYGVGHPCFVKFAGISCGSTGAGPLYPGFDATIRYTSPRIFGFEGNVAIVDPYVNYNFKMSPYPRFDADVNFDKTWGIIRARFMGQYMLNRVGTSTPPSGMMDGTLTMRNIYGLMGAGILNVGPGVVGFGGWSGKGVGERVPLEANDAANPISNDQQFNLREFRGFFGNAGGTIGPLTLIAGGGILYVRKTSVDRLPPADVPNNVLTSQWEYHVVANYRIDSIIFNVEYMHWQSNWNLGEKQNINFMGGGVNYVW